MKYSKAESWLSENDEIMSRLIADNSPVSQRPGRENYFESLARSIVGQQISVKAATKIFGRLVELTKLDPYSVAMMDDDVVREVGLSAQKRRYLIDLAQHFVDNPKIYDHLDKLPDESVVTELTRVNGIGVWTAQMFLMFTLHRPDIFAPDDRGLQTAIETNYGVKKLSRKDLVQFAARWSPYRSTACLYLWESLHNTP